MGSVDRGSVMESRLSEKLEWIWRDVGYCFSRGFQSGEIDFRGQILERRQDFFLNYRKVHLDRGTISLYFLLRLWIIFTVNFTINFSEKFGLARKFLEKMFLK